MEFEVFLKHDLVKEKQDEYQKKLVRFYNHGKIELVKLMNDFNDDYYEKAKIKLCIDFESRVKDLKSTLNKFYRNVMAAIDKRPFDKETADLCFNSIHDLLGFRYKVEYYDNVLDSVQLMKGYFRGRGFATDLTDFGIEDKNYLDRADNFGYRSYHFFIKGPIPVDIYDRRENILFEIQARTEIQHIWASRSHNLVFKRFEDSVPNQIQTAMVALSDHLHGTDLGFANVRDEVSKTLPENA